MTDRYKPTAMWSRSLQSEVQKYQRMQRAKAKKENASCTTQATGSTKTTGTQPANQEETTGSPCTASQTCTTSTSTGTSSTGTNPTEACEDKGDGEKESPASS